MKLYGSLTSPFVRAVRIAALELGLGDRVEMTLTVVRPAEPNRAYGERVNPLRRVPALETDAGDVIIDSRVIIEFLNQEAGGALVPEAGPARIACLNRHAVVAGAAEALVSAMYENRLRAEEKRWQAFGEDQIDKAEAALEWADARVGEFRAAFDLSAIGLVCLVDYAQFRFPQVNWLRGRGALKAYADACEARASVRDTAPRDA